MTADTRSAVAQVAAATTTMGPLVGLFSRNPRAKDFTAVVARMRRDYELGRVKQVYAERDGYGYGIDESAMPQKEWFWFNAYAALAGIRLGYNPLVGYLAGYCGMATSSVDWDEPAQVAAGQEIEKAAFG